jgi:hypothetical protein
MAAARDSISIWIVEFSMCIAGVKINYGHLRSASDGAMKSIVQGAVAPINLSSSTYYGGAGWFLRCKMHDVKSGQGLDRDGCS